MRTVYPEIRLETTVDFNNVFHVSCSTNLRKQDKDGKWRYRLIQRNHDVLLKTDTFSAFAMPKRGQDDIMSETINQAYSEFMREIYFAQLFGVIPDNATDLYGEEMFKLCETQESEEERIKMFYNL